MVELKFGLRTVDLPYTVRIPDVTAEMFDDLVDEDMKAELIDGVMIVHSPATLRHDDVGGFVRSLMSFYADALALGKVLGPDGLIHLRTCRKFAPDLFFIRKARVPVRLPKEFRGAADLVGEVLSPSNRDEDLEDKRPAYKEAGVGEIWWIDLANEQVLIDRKRGRGYVEQVVRKGRVSSTILKGFWIDVAWLWAEPLPNKVKCLQKILASQ